MKYIYNATIQEFRFIEPVHSMTSADVKRLFEYAQRRIPHRGQSAQYEAAHWVGDTAEDLT